jgi:hypothetical protein
MKGDFFSWLSHDDLYYPYKIEEQVYFYHSLHQEKAIIYSNDILIDDNGTIISKKIDIHNHNCLPFFLLYRRFIGGCSLLIPKKAFDAAGPFNEQYQTIQDYDMWYRMMNNGYSFRYLPIIAVKSRIHKGQTSNTKKKEYLEEKNKFFISVQEYLDPQLWIEKCNNKAICYFKLAIEFKLNGEDKVFYYDLKKGIAEVKKNKIKGIIIFGEFLISLIYQIVRGKISSFLYR